MKNIAIFFLIHTSTALMSTSKTSRQKRPTTAPYHIPQPNQNYLNRHPVQRLKLAGRTAVFVSYLDLPGENRSWISACQVSCCLHCAVHTNSSRLVPGHKCENCRTCYQDRVLLSHIGLGHHVSHGVPGGLKFGFPSLRCHPSASCEGVDLLHVHCQLVTEGGLVESELTTNLSFAPLAPHPWQQPPRPCPSAQLPTDGLAPPTVHTYRQSDLQTAAQQESETQRHLAIRLSLQVQKDLWLSHCNSANPAVLPNPILPLPGLSQPTSIPEPLDYSIAGLERWADRHYNCLERVHPAPPPGFSAPHSYHAPPAYHLPQRSQYSAPELESTAPAVNLSEVQPQLRPSPPTVHLIEDQPQLRSSPLPEAAPVKPSVEPPTNTSVTDRARPPRKRKSAVKRISPPPVPNNSPVSSDSERLVIA